MNRSSLVLVIVGVCLFAGQAPAQAQSFGVDLRPESTGGRGPVITADGTIVLGEGTGGVNYGSPNVTIERIAPGSTKLEPLFDIEWGSAWRLLAAGSGFVLEGKDYSNFNCTKYGCMSRIDRYWLSYYADPTAPPRNLFECSSDCGDCLDAYALAADEASMLVAPTCANSKGQKPPATVYDIATGAATPVDLKWLGRIRLEGPYLSQIAPGTGGTVDGEVLDWRTGTVVRRVQGNTPTGMTDFYDLLPDGTLVYSGPDSRVFRFGPGDAEPRALPIEGLVFGATADLILTTTREGNFYTPAKVWSPDGTLVDSLGGLGPIDGRRVVYLDPLGRFCGDHWRLQVWQVGSGPPPPNGECPSNPAGYPRPAPTLWLLELRRTKLAERAAYGPTKVRARFTCHDPWGQGCQAMVSLVLPFGILRNVLVTMRPDEKRWLKLAWGASLGRCRALGRHRTLAVDVDPGVTKRLKVQVRGYC